MSAVLQFVGTQVLVFGGWSIIDSIGTRILLEALYSVPVPQLRLKRPPRNTLAAKSHREVACILLAIAYFVWCLAQMTLSMKPSAYGALGVPVYASDSAIKRKFRELAKVYHPDKVGEEHADVFRILHEKYSFISDPESRSLYDKFGPKLYTWEMLSTVSEFMHRGLKEQVFSHVTLCIQQAIAAALNFGRWSSRSLSVGSMMCLFIVQVRLLTNERWSMWLAYATNATVFQAIAITTHIFFPFMLVLQQCHLSFDQLLVAGSWHHFRRASDPEPVLVESPESLLRARVLHSLRHEPETLSEAREQLTVLIAAIQELDAKAEQLWPSESDK